MSRFIMTVFAAGWLIVVVVPQLEADARHGQVAVDQDTGLAELSGESRVSLLTSGTDPHWMRLFGHSMIRVADPPNGIDLVFGYGVFDATDPWLLAKVLTERLDAGLSMDYFFQILEEERYLGRGCTEQLLDLDLESRKRLYRRLMGQSLAGDYSYRYDTIRNNCTTRILEDLVQCSADRLEFAPGGDRAGPSYRQLAIEYLGSSGFIRQVFFSLLGKSAEPPLGARESCFLPRHLMDNLARASWAGPGGRRPVVRETTVLVAPRARALPAWQAGASDGLWWGLSAMALATAWRTVTGRRPPGRGRIVPVLDAALFMASGLLGSVILLIDIANQHLAFSQNLNLAWLLPGNCLLASWAFHRTSTPLARRLFLASGLVTLAPLLLWPVWPQQLHPFMAPVMLLIGLRLLDHAGRSIPLLPLVDEPREAT